MTLHTSPQARREKLLSMIPFYCADQDSYPCSATLLQRIGDEGRKSDRLPESRRRQIERDLDALLDLGCIEVVVTKQNRRHFRRVVKDRAKDPRLKAYVEALSKAMLEQQLPSARQAQLWAVLDDQQHAPLLEEKYFRAINDNQRLLPAAIKVEVLQSVLAGLIQRQVLQVLYEKQDGSRQEALLHPQGLLQRGPILYLYALKNDEAEAKKFALHRMIRASEQPMPARDDANFDLDQRIRDGEADYGHGEKVQLKLRVRGYVTQLLRDCQLDEQQKIKDLEPPRNGFEAEVSAEVPSTGQLYRWLLGFGPLVEVLEPPHLREMLGRAALQMSALYRQGADRDDAGEA